MREVIVASHKDVEDIVELGREQWDEHYYSKVGEYDQQNTRTVLHSMVDGEHTVVFVAKDNDRIAGYIAFVATPVLWSNILSAVEVVNWVAMDQRRNGIGTELLDAGAEWAQIMGCQLMETHNYEGRKVPRWVDDP
jgi:predicted N-acetyltransferase YhbS